jgi:hypothetical protein
MVIHAQKKMQETNTLEEAKRFLADHKNERTLGECRGENTFQSEKVDVHYRGAFSCNFGQHGNTDVRFIFSWVNSEL